MTEPGFPPDQPPDPPPDPRPDGALEQGAGGRWELLDAVAVDVSDLRRELRAQTDAHRELAGTLSEELPRLGDVETAVRQLGVQVAALAAQRDDTAESPYSDAALAAHGYTPDPGHMVDWSLMDPEQAAAAWEALGRWVGQVLCGVHRVTRRELPDCWALHMPAVIALSWCHQHHRLLVAAGATAAMAEWHTRWLPAALDAVRRTIDPDACAPGLHHQLDQTARHHLTAERRAAARPRPAAAGEGPEHHPGGQARTEMQCRRALPWFDRPRLFGSSDWLDEDRASSRGGYERRREQHAGERARPGHWLALFHEASAVDLADRLAGAHEHTDADYRPGTPGPRGVEDPAESAS